MQILTFAAKEQSWLMLVLLLSGVAFLSIVLTVAGFLIVDAVRNLRWSMRWDRATPEQRTAMLRKKYPLSVATPSVLDIFERVARREMTPEEGAMRLGEIPERDEQ